MFFFQIYCLLERTLHRPKLTTELLSMRYQTTYVWRLFNPSPIKIAPL